MHRDIQSWLEEIREESAIQWKYRKYVMKEDPENYGGILKSFLDEKEHYCTGCGLLLTGTDHYSREATAVKMLEYLEQTEYGGYEAIFLDGMELGEDGSEQAIARLNGLLDTFYDLKTGLCLVLEKLEGSSCRWEVLRFLGRQLRAYWLYPEEYTPLFLILMDDLEQETPDLLRSRLRLFRTNIPDQNQRAAYLKTYGASLKEYLSLDLFAQLTEGAGYAQLRDMIEACGWLVDSRDSFTLTDEELAAFLATQMPALSGKAVTQRFYQSLQELVERIPEILSSMPTQQIITAEQTVASLSANASSQVSLSFDSRADESNYIKTKEKEILEMAPKTLIEDVLSYEYLQKSVIHS